MEAMTMTQEMTQETHNLIASDRVEGKPVRRPNGEKIGAIQRLMIDKRDGKVAYAVLKYGGGFLGIGRKHMPIPWPRLKYDPAHEAYQLDLTDDELSRARACEANKEFDWGNRIPPIRDYSPNHWGAY